MKPVLGALSLALLAGLSGCGYLAGEDGYFRDRGSDYQGVVIEPRIDIPEGVESKPLGDLLPVPGQSVAEASGEKFKLPRPQPMIVSADAAEFSLQQNGSVRWVQAQRSASDTWPLVRQFWNDYQVPVASETPSLGQLQTGWVAFDLQSNNPLLRRILPAIGEGRSVEGREHRFRLRVEPGVQGDSSEIYVTHMSRSQGGSRTDWPENSDNANLERAVLAELETYLNQSRSGASITSLMAAQAGPRATLARDGAGNPVLTLQSDFNRAWSAIGQALSQADIRIADLNRSAGVYYIDLAQAASQQKEPGFFGRLFGRDETPDEDRAQRTEVRLTAVGGNVQVTVDESIDTAADPRVAVDVLERIQANLN
ncbi:outer membrane protein assembly factor BamC [Halopseudomonas sp.]|uniref:outer membrane protein assembly factor BamC n=1 Tax=Halopseudomonas sp. TaxID=2901191 RepID=UPI00356B47D7